MTRDKTEWQDTEQLEPRAAPAPTPTDAEPAADARDTVPGPQDDDFAHTEVLPRAEPDRPLWAEAADGRCSDDAAEFAASQPAPLNIV